MHLTFQEYLAAWNLANLSMGGIKSTISPHLRDARWFETLQLLGGELAKVSDEKLDQYVGYLLDNIGQSLSAQAPLIALCANIIEDVRDVADISSGTREQYLSSLRGTLHVFRLESGVPAKTQLEVLTALIPLGASVKDHLIQATKSSHHSVRTEAVNTLVPHVPDNDLFDMLHVLKDRSQEPVFAYLSALFERDRGRAIQVLSTADLSGPKVAKALVMLMWHFYIRRDTIDLLHIFKRALAYSSKVSLWDVAWSLYSRPLMWDQIENEVLSWTGDASNILRQRMVMLLGYILRLRRGDMSTLYQIAVEDASPAVRADAVRSIYSNDNSPSSKEFLQQRALEDPSEKVRSVILELLFYKVDDSSIKSYTRYFLTRDFYWAQFRDPADPITHEWAVTCSRVFRVPLEEIKMEFRKLADLLPITLQFGNDEPNVTSSSHSDGSDGLEKV